MSLEEPTVKPLIPEKVMLIRKCKKLAREILERNGETQGKT